MFDFVFCIPVRTILRNAYYYFIFFLLLFSSCRKETDTVPPSVNITSPFENQDFSVFDTIQISGTAEDNIKLSSLSVCLTDENIKPVLASHSFETNAQKTGFNTYYPIDNIHLNSGVYYIWARASDGINSSNAYRKVNIQALPIELKDIFVLSATNPAHVYSLDPGGQFTQRFDYSGFVQDAVVSSYFQQIYILGKTNNKLTAYNCPDIELLWELDQVSNPSCVWSSRLKIEKNILYVAYSSGSICGIDGNGIKRQCFTISNTLFQPGIFSKHFSYLAAVETSTDNQKDRIELFNYSTGSPLFYHETEYDVVDLFSYNEDRMLIFGNLKEEAKVCTLSVHYNQHDEMNGLPNEKLHSAIQVESSIFLISAGNNIYKYTSASNQFSVYLPGRQADMMKFEEINSAVYFLHGDSLDIMHYPSKIFLLQTVFPDPIVDVEFLYNR